MAYTTIKVSSDYGYVVLAAASTFVMNLLHAANTVKARKAALVPYPIAYATPEENKSSPAHMAFSCAQRAHANFIEQQPSILASLLISGLYYPRLAAGLGFFWTINRYIYMVGYTTSKSGGKGRVKGFGFALAQFGLIGLSVVTGLQMTGLV